MKETESDKNPTSYEQAMKLHDLLISRGKMVRVNTKDGKEFFVEFPSRQTGQWHRCS